MKIKGIYAYSLVMVSGDVTYSLFVWASGFVLLLVSIACYRGDLFTVFNHCPNFIMLNVAVLRVGVSVLFYHCFHYVSLMQVSVKSH
jgi:hypothetical protein